MSGRRVSLKSVDAPKGNGVGPKKTQKKQLTLSPMKALCFVIQCGVDVPYESVQSFITI